MLLPNALVCPGLRYGRQEGHTLTLTSSGRPAGRALGTQDRSPVGWSEHTLSSLRAGLSQVCSFPDKAQSLPKESLALVCLHLREQTFAMSR